MDCKTASSKIQSFLSDSLSVKEQREFIRHISACENCRKDTELLLMFRKAEETVREKSRSDFDFSHLLDDKIGLIRKEQRKKQFFILFLFALSAILLVLLLLILVFYIGR